MFKVIPVYVYTCIRVYVYTCICVDTYTCIGVYVRTCICAHVYMHVRVRVCKGRKMVADFLAEIYNQTINMYAQSTY